MEISTFEEKLKIYRLLEKYVRENTYISSDVKNAFTEEPIFISYFKDTLYYGLESLSM